MSSYSSRQSSRRSARSLANPAGDDALGAALAYVECLWNLAEVEQKATVFKLRIQHIEKWIKEIVDSPNGPRLTAAETAELSVWRNDMRPKMWAWVTRTEVKDLQTRGMELCQRYKESRIKQRLGVYEAPRFVINCVESQERLDIQKKFDVGREVLVMSNSEVLLSHQDINNLRASAGRARVLYIGCPLITPDLSVEKELEALEAVGDIINSLQIWVPASTARLVGTDRSGTPLDEDLWSDYFDSLGYMRLEEPAIAPAIARVLAPMTLAPPAAQPANPAPEEHGSDDYLPEAPDHDIDEDSEDDSDDDDPTPGLAAWSWPAAPAYTPAPAYAPAPAPIAAPLHFHPYFPQPQAQPQPQPQLPPANAIAIANAAVSRHGRPIPYNPTPQPRRHLNGVPTKWNNVRGNTPGNVDVFFYDKLYNRKDSNHNKTDRAAAKAARDNGATRDLAIDDLIRDGLLPVGFQDTNP